MMFGHPERRVLFLAAPPLVFALSCLQGCRPAADPVRWADAHGYGVDETARISMGPHKAPLVPGRIDARDAKVFLDTGNFFGPQISPGLVEALDLSPSGSERRSYASDGTYRNSQRGFQVGHFRVFRMEFRDLEMFELADDTYDAIVGIGALLDGRFTIDYGNRLMGFSRVPREATGPATAALPLIWNDALKGMIVVEGRVDGIKTLFQIDTGKSRTTIDRDLIARAGLKKRHTLLQRGYRVDLITLGTRRFSVACAKAASFKAISEGYPEPILVGIGADILSRLVMTVDYRQRMVFIE